MSIDREVNSVANAYMGNETALQNKYAMEKQLIDLLALQKLKSEQDAAEKERQMKAQVSPTTVADQLKQQIVGDMPPEGILAAAQGGMVRGFAEGGGVDLNEAVQTLPFDETVDTDLNEAVQTLPFDETVDADPDNIEKLLDSSSEEGTVENPDTGEQVTKVGGAIANWAMDNPVDAISLGLMFIPGIGWGAAAGLRGLGLAYKGLKGIDYLSKGKNIGQGIVKGSQGLGRLAQKGFTVPKTRIPKGQAGAGQFVKRGSRAISLGRTAVVGGPLTGWALRSIGDLYENGFSDEDIEEAIASGQLTQVSGTDTDTSTGATGTGATGTGATGTGATGTGATGTGATGTGATGTGATTESPRRSAYDKLMEDYGATYKDQIANLNKEDRIKRREDRLARLAEINKPEERSFLDVASDFLAGASASGIGGGGDALRQAEIASRKRKKDYQTMLVENEEQIDNLTQTLGDQEMAIKLTAATNEYARDIAATALAIENARDRRDFIFRSLQEMDGRIESDIISNPFYQGKLYTEGPAAAKEFARSLRENLMQSPNRKILYKMLADMGVSLTDPSSGASSSGLVYGTPYIPDQK